MFIFYYFYISADDLKLFYRTNSVDEAFEYITGELAEHALESPGPVL